MFSSKRIKQQESHVRDRLKYDPSAKYLKQHGYSDQQILMKFRQQYYGHDHGKHSNDYISSNTMHAAENYAKTHKKR